MNSNSTANPLSDARRVALEGIAGQHTVDIDTLAAQVAAFEGAGQPLPPNLRMSLGYAQSAQSAQHELDK